MTASNQQPAPDASTPPISGNLVRVAAVSRRLALSERMVLLLAQRGTIPCIRIGKLVRFDLDAVVAAIDAKQSERLAHPAPTQHAA